MININSFKQEEKLNTPKSIDLIEEKIVKPNSSSQERETDEPRLLLRKFLVNDPQNENINDAMVNVARYMPYARIFPISKDRIYLHNIARKAGVLNYVNVVILTDEKNGVHRKISERIVRDIVDGPRRRLSDRMIQKCNHATKVVYIRNSKVLGETSVAFKSAKEFVRKMILEIPTGTHLYIDLTNLNEEVISLLVYILRYAKVNLGCTDVSMYNDNELTATGFDMSLVVLEGGTI